MNQNLDFNADMDFFLSLYKNIEKYTVIDYLLINLHSVKKEKKTKKTSRRVDALVWLINISYIWVINM